LLLSPQFEACRRRPGRVWRVVLRMTRVPVAPEQRTAVATRVGPIVRADGGDLRLQIGDQAQERLAQMPVVILAVLLEPGLVVVPGQLAQETESLVGEVDAHASSRSRSRPHASSASSRAWPGPAGVVSRKRAISPR